MTEPTLRERMDEAGVTRVSELSDLHGKAVQYDGEPGTIDYIGSGRFRCTLDSGRQPWGAVDALVASGDGFTFTTPEG